MIKYIRIKYTASKSALIPVGQGLFVELATASKVKIYSSADSSYYFFIETTGATFAMVSAIQAACVQAAQTSWTRPIWDVVIPDGEAVDDIAVTTF
jgi:prefoldin subunit 5